MQLLLGDLGGIRGHVHGHVGGGDGQRDIGQLEALVRLQSERLRHKRLQPGRVDAHHIGAGLQTREKEVPRAISHRLRQRRGGRGDLRVGLRYQLDAGPGNQPAADIRNNANDRRPPGFPLRLHKAGSIRQLRHGDLSCRA